MDNKKRIISLVGTTCVGKSTILKVLNQTSSSSVMVIPQVTQRKPRTDDVSDFFIYKDKINSDEMFLYNRELSYGISNQSILKFLNSDYLVAIMINGTDEIEMLQEKYRYQKNADIDFKNVLITFSDDYKKELVALEQSLPKFFDGINIKKRYDFFKEHIENKLLNPNFIKKHIDVHLTREMSLIRWSFELSKLTKTAPHAIMYNLQQNIGKSEKQQKLYVSLEKRQLIKQIVSSLKDNRR